ncbi:MAG: hypothetical protein FWE90_08495 [Defluviitaleaceae bacterium]|nr:hypothetical protein [Defluviitaleaceae bacterium]
MPMNVDIKKYIKISIIIVAFIFTGFFLTACTSGDDEPYAAVFPVIDDTIPDEIISSVLALFDSINNGDLAVFRTALHMQDSLETYRNMNIIGGFFSNVVGVSQEEISRRIAENIELTTLMDMLFNDEFPLQPRDDFLMVMEIRRSQTEPPEWITDVLEVIVSTGLPERGTVQHVFEIHVADGANGWSGIGITNAAGWLDI